MQHKFASALALATAIAAVASPAAGRTRHHRHDTLAPAPVAALPSPRPTSYYPYEIEGGVSGNLPFNNQLRKLSDPLNANGGK